MTARCEHGIVRTERNRAQLEPTKHANSIVVRETVESISVYLLLIVCIELRPEGRLFHVEDVDEAFLTASGQEADLLACRSPVAPPDRLHGGLRRNRQLHLWFALLG